MATKQARKALTLDEKVKVVKLSDSMSDRRSVEELGVGRTQILNILKRKVDVLVDYDAHQQSEKSTIQKRFKRCGFSVDAVCEEEDPEDDIPLSVLCLAMGLISCDSDALPTFDDKVATCDNMEIDSTMNAKSLMATTNDCESDSEPSVVDVETKTSINEVDTILEKLRKYSLQTGNDPFLNNVMGLMDQALNLRLHQYNTQRTIDQFLLKD